MLVSGLWMGMVVYDQVFVGVGNSQLNEKLCVNGNSKKTEEGLWSGMVVCELVHDCIGNSQETEDGMWLGMAVGS